MINIEQLEHVLKISYINEDGNIDFVNIQIPESEKYEWHYSKTSKSDPSIRSWDNKAVVKNKAKYLLSRTRVEEILAKQPQDIQDKIYAYNDPKKFFVDIEVNNDDEWPTPAVARHEITAISFSHKQLLCVMGTKKLTADEIKTIGNSINEYLATKNYLPVDFNYICYETEYDLLYTFFNKWIQKMPLITGWNFTEFDWAYLVARAKKLAIDPSVASPCGKLTGKLNLPMHRIVCDYMEIYKKWDRVVFKENNSLDYVAKAATGIGKISYNGTLADLYVSDFPKYIYYNAIDSVLVRLIDEKISTMNIMFKLAKVTKSEILRVFSPIAMTENVTICEFYKRGKVFTNDKREKATKEEYEGGYVFEPTPDLYSWIGIYDFASLYPSVMRQWNISPESYLGKLSIDELKTIERNPNYTYTASGAYFDNTKDSVFRTILDNLYAQRKSAKRTMEEIETEIDKLKELKSTL